MLLELVIAAATLTGFSQGLYRLRVQVYEGIHPQPQLEKTAAALLVKRGIKAYQDVGPVDYHHETGLLRVRITRHQAEHGLNAGNVHIMVLRPGAVDTWNRSRRVPVAVYSGNWLFQCAPDAWGKARKYVFNQALTEFIQHWMDGRELEEAAA
jgi:hypothetical protein